ncbi:MAG TPA: hypothetical protein PLD99_01475 [Parcubacteria group bacterium]|nr:hypothetical protein [Parcubacteria group bacterium]
MANCSFVIVHCIDFRTQKSGKKLRRSLGISEKDCDVISVPGGAGNIEQLKHCLELSHRLHHTSTAILTVHEDCGAGAKKEDLKKAASIAIQIGLKPRCFFIKLDRKWEEIMV